MKNFFYGFYGAVLIMPVIVQAQYFLPQNPGLARTDGTASGIVELVLGWVLSFLAVLAILVIVIAGVMYIVSGGDEDRIKTAKNMLLYGIIGLVVALLAYAIVYAISFGLRAG